METLYRHLTALSEPVRVRLLSLLGDEELGVGELCRIVQLPQSTVSRHLKLLLTEGLVLRRAEGTRSLFRLAVDDPATAALWAAVDGPFRRSHQHAEDRARLASVLAARAAEGDSFFGREHARWDALRSELFGDHVLEAGLAALLPPAAVVVDLGCGTGANLVRFGPWVGRAIGIDREPAMLAAAAERTQGAANVELHPAPLEELPLPDAVADLALCTLVLHHVESPERVLAEARRVLRAGGALVVVDMVAHDRSDWRHTMGHRWLGFDLDQLARWGRGAGFATVDARPLPPRPEAQGPPLFVARLS